MEISNETKVESLIELIKEDRIEIREIKKNLFSTIQLFVIASVGITAYGFKPSDHPKFSWLYLVVVDVLFISISWVFFYLRNRDVLNARKSLKTRQNQLTKDFHYDYFPKSEKTHPDIKDKDLYNVIIIASIIYIALIAFTIFIFK